MELLSWIYPMIGMASADLLEACQTDLGANVARCAQLNAVIEVLQTDAVVLVGELDELARKSALSEKRLKCVDTIPYWVFIEEAAIREGVDPFIVAGLIVPESANDPIAIGDDGNARGLGQIWEATWGELSDEDWWEAYNPRKNINAIAKFLKKYSAWIESSYGLGDIRWTLACWNWGSGMVKGHLDNGRPWDTVPANVQRNAAKYLHATNAYRTICE
tara:strand:- start:8179 stop:8832 length:654 start_codon:yes stop_codon:yes gene_type:complete